MIEPPLDGGADKDVLPMPERETFEHLVSGLQHSHASPEPGPAAPETFVNPLAGAALPIADEPADPGVADLWDHAAAWAPDSEADEASTLPAPSDDVEAIASELDLANASTREEILRARRRFMWKYHPDRHPEISADSAGRRVALANTLVDLALAALAKRPPTHGSPGSG
jgi:hypothetical protein